MSKDESPARRRYREIMLARTAREAEAASAPELPADAVVEDDEEDEEDEDEVEESIPPHVHDLTGWQRAVVAVALVIACVAGIVAWRATSVIGDRDREIRDLRNRVDDLEDRVLRIQRGW